MLECLECFHLVSEKKLEEQGVVQCDRCATRLLPTDTKALTYLDEMPLDEYLGG